MVYVNLRLACLSVVALLYQAQALPLPVKSGDVVSMQPPAQGGAGGLHPHIVMGAASPGHPEGHNIVVATVSHSGHPDQEHTLPVPANQHGAPHGLTGEVGQMRTAHTNDIHHATNQQVDDAARHTIASSHHQAAANAHTDAANSHLTAAVSFNGVGNHDAAAKSALQAAGHTNTANVHASESHNHALAAAGQPHAAGMQMSLSNVTPSKKLAEQSAENARHMHQITISEAHVNAAIANTNAGIAHQGAAAAHTATGASFRAAGEHFLADQNDKLVNIHTQQQQFHNAQAVDHINPNVRQGLDQAIESSNAAKDSHTWATQSQISAEKANHVAQNLPHAPGHH